MAITAFCPNWQTQNPARSDKPQCRAAAGKSGEISERLGEKLNRTLWGAGRLLWQFRPGDPVLGKRYRISANLRAKPISETAANQLSNVLGRQI
jgi:hypothetical protein